MSAAPNIPSPEARAEVCDAAADMIDGIAKQLVQAFCLVGGAGVTTGNGHARWYRNLVDTDALLRAAVEDLRVRSKAFRVPLPAEPTAPAAPVVRTRRRRAVSL